MTDYTPTTEQVRDTYVRELRRAHIGSARDIEAEFDRWLETIQHHAWNGGAMWGDLNHGALTDVAGRFRAPDDNPWHAHPLGPQDGDNT